MSRIGKLPISIPDGVTVSFKDHVLTVKGSMGELTQSFPLQVSLDIQEAEKTVVVSVVNPKKKQQSAYWGMARSIAENMIIGVTEGYKKELEINGVGYRAAMEGGKIVLHLGYSHPIELQPPEGVTVEVQKNIVTVSGIDKQAVGEFAANIRKQRKPEPYKGKGIKYSDELVRRKAGKQLKGAGE
ncbi:MAG: 50S ribosomal protein L6 [Candidatus Jacksonbacteria bacterium]|jgi:large subunit ribosomal protein L6|nr:50S ribosomal protein L6 [Candidatus Jacksonbacteria bacterium]MBT6034084.1 50S ribosomal protein L6 [Candidatus Jacksonbacteria bacterium]MBT6301119.1 50S ribosomal protein L6 [Candidatus Jacksonbacteria bacterium]MBT6757298.1 50S ribosomal protein L6 [Candidatus Jacksonbacteria bacterium]MBT6955621.1 50S ribosomal protein L6 [Candidatus Jacksonbacteria bacterium]